MSPSKSASFPYIPAWKFITVLTLLAPVICFSQNSLPNDTIDNGMGAGQEALYGGLDVNSIPTPTAEDLVELENCFEVVTPYNILLDDGQIISVTWTGSEIMEQLAIQYPNNTPSGYAYPFSVILSDGTQSTLHNEIQLQSLVLECMGY